MIWNQPLTLRCGLTLPNRIMMAPMTVFSSHPDGIPSAAELSYYQARANTGPGAVITACAYVASNGIGFPNSLAIDTDERLPQLTRLAAAIKESGTPAILQIFHAGRMGLAEDLVSASAVAADRLDARTPRELTDAEVTDLVETFAATTRRAITAGFDGVEIHGANTYLIQQFFSPHSNRRTDRWGGDTAQERLAFPEAVVDAVLAVRAEARHPFAVGYRLSPEEIENPGITLSDTDVLVDFLATTNLDYLSISTPQFTQASLRDPGITEFAAIRIAQRIAGRLPVIGSGGLDTSERIASALTSVDAVAVAHQFIYDHRFLTKLRAGRETDLITVLDDKRRENYELPSALWETLRARQPWFTFTSPSIPPVVTAAFVTENPDAILVDSRWYLDGRDGLAAYTAGHLPGAIFVDLNTDLAAPPCPQAGRHPLPEPGDFATAMGRLGISPTSTVIVYDDCGGQVAARLVWMLRALGSNAALLDGGIAAWTGDLETTPTTLAAVDFPVQPWPGDQLADIEAAARAQADGVVLIDARAGARYRGEVEPVDPRAGHIPGARSAPCSGNLDETGRFRSVAQLQERFAALGITGETPVISYCGSGVTACHNLLALERAGLTSTALYPGSWSQWSSDPQRPAAAS